MEDKKEIEYKADYLRATFETPMAGSDFEEKEVYDMVLEIASYLGVSEDEIAEKLYASLSTIKRWHGEALLKIKFEDDTC